MAPRHSADTTEQRLRRAAQYRAARVMEDIIPPGAIHEIALVTALAQKPRALV
jgi:hypothetical protein